MTSWLSVIGIGEDGLTGLSPIARTLLDRAALLVGGKRHLDMLPSDDPRKKLTWSVPFEHSVHEILKRQGQAVCVLASGDPLCYGVATTLLRKIDITEMTIIPAPSAFSLACARLGWTRTEIETLSLCGRSPALLHGLLYPGAKILALSEGGHTPQVVAQLLNRCGYGDSQLTVLERLGGEQERQVEGKAMNWGQGKLPGFAALNVLAIACPAERVPALPRQAGLPDTAYRHDGQLTKQEVRAVTIAALTPLPGQLLWDVGAGCGSIGIEWMRSHPRCQAIAVEQHPERLDLIAHNAAALGTPGLTIVAGKAPESLSGLPRPDAIFIGGGLTAPDQLRICWESLKGGGRLVVNAVTIESEQAVFAGQQSLGGELKRIAIQRAEPIGQFLGWKALAPITQWTVIKPF